MSISARNILVHGGRVFFQHYTERTDLLNIAATGTQLIALLTDAAKVNKLEITAVRTDHHNDGGGHSHANGDAADLWPLGTGAGDYLVGDSEAFRMFLRACAASVWCFAIGLGGSAYNAANLESCGDKGFRDDSQDHVHLEAIL